MYPLASVARSAWSRLTGMLTIRTHTARVQAVAALALMSACALLAGTPQTIRFDIIPHQILGASPFPIAAQATSLLPVTFTSLTTSVCKIHVSNLVVLRSTGTCTIQATQPGGGAYNAANPVNQSFGVITAPTGTLTAAAGSPISLAGNDYQVAAGDFNGDGKPDIAVVNQNNLTVLLGNGLGGFTPTAGSPYTTGAFPEGLAVGDFNGDGFADIVTANRVDNNVTVLLGNGSGGFTQAAGSPFSVGGASPGPVKVVVGDFNGDGIQDLATANNIGNSVSVLLGNGSGGFTLTAASPFAVGTGPQQVVVGDFNGDNFADLAVALSGAGTVAVLLGNGSGGFAAASGSPYTVGAQPNSLAVGDFNGDGNEDIATTSASNAKITVLLGNGSGGFSAAAGSPFATGGSVGEFVVVGDFNGDGLPDIAGISPGLTTILIGNGSGGFTEALGNSGTFSGEGGYAGVAVDVNNDGLLDLVTVYGQNSVINVLLGSIETTQSVLTSTSPASIAAGTSVPLTLTVSRTTTEFNAPTGTATFMDGATMLGTASQNTSPFTFTATGLSVGSHTFTASYGGDTRNASSASGSSVTIMVLQSQTITFGPLSNAALNSGPVNLSATASSGLPVAYTSSTLPVCTVSGNVVTLVATGTCSITAAQPGNGSYAAATNVVQSFSVTPAGMQSQTITFNAIPNQFLGASPFPVAAQASSLLPVSLSVTTPAVCLHSGDLIMPVHTGTCSITATQPGNGSFNPATPVVQSFTVSAALPSVSYTVNPGPALAAGSSPNSVVTGDFNGDGIPDLAIANYNSNNVAVLLGNGSGGFAAAPGSPFAVGTNPRGLAAGDFNGDGIQDLAVANFGSNNVTVLLGNGSGGFGPAPGSPIAVGTNAFSVGVGDFNGDGIQDLAVPNGGTNNVSVLLGNGLGGFAPASGSPLAVGSTPIYVAVGDFNGDGYQDLAVPNNGDGTVTVLLGNGAAGFATSPGSPFAAGTFPRTVVVGDFNGDGYQDLAIANSGSGNVTVLLGNGSGGFAAGPGSPFTVGADPVALAVGDVNGDGIQDLAVSNFNSSNVSVLLGNGSGGFAAQSGSPFTVPANAVWLAVGDFNRDGVEDLAVVEQNPAALAVLLGVAATPQTITFGLLSNVTYGVAPFTVGATASSGLAVSFTSTTLSVCTVSGNTVTIVGAGSCSIVASQAGNASFAPAPPVTQSFTVNQAPQTITFGPLSNQTLASTPPPLSATASSGLAVAYTSNNLSVCTVAGVNITLLATGTCPITANQAGNANYVAAAPVTQTFTVTSLISQTITFGPLSNQGLTSTPPPLSASASSGLVVAYTSNTPSVCTVLGANITLLTTGTCSITANQAGNAVYAAAAPVTQTFMVVNLASQTIAFDAIPNQLFGVSPFPIAVQASSLLPVTTMSTTTAVCAIADDLVMLLNAGTCSITASQGGNGSFVAATPVTRSFTVSRALPAGTLTAAAGIALTGGSAPDSMVAGDFNGDGIPDLAIANSNGNNVAVLLGNGSGGFTAAPGSPFAAGTGPRYVTTGDFNGDGFEDLAVANYTSNNVTVLLGNGLGGFAAASGSPFATGANPASIAVGDFNGDGIQDLSVANSASASLTVLLGNGSGGFTLATGSPFAAGSVPYSVAVGDFNGDGIEDLAATNFNSGTVTVLLGNGSGGFAAASGSPFAVGTQPRSVVVGDFDGDGNQDLAIANGVSNNVTVLLGNGSGGFTSAAGSPFAAGTGPQSVVAEDFNGDGFADLAIANYNSNNVTVLLGNGSGGFTAAAGSPFAVTGNASWLAVGDFNRDGIPDLASVNGNPANLAVLLGSLSPTTSVLSTTSPLTISPGASVPLTLTVTDPGGAFNPLTGMATFSDGVTVLGTATQTGSPYTFTASSLGAGTHVLSAAYAGGSGSAASSSNTISIRVLASQTITFGPLSNVALSSGTVTLSATASSGLAVTYTSNTLPVCTVSGSTVTLVATGTCSITANQAGNGTYAAATPVTQTFTVSSLTSQTITFGPLSNVALSSGTVTLTATASSGLAVTYTSNTLPVCTVAGSTVTLVSAGTCSITANQAGNGTYAAATPGTQTFTVTSGSQTITFDAIPNQILGASPFAIAAQVNTLLPVGFASTTPTVCKTADDLVTLLSAGMCSITASEVGGAAPVTRTFTVSRANAAGTLTAAVGSPFPVGTNPFAAAVGDFNGDGIPDLATVNQGSNDVTVLLGNGSGGFTAAPGSPFSVGGNPYFVAVGDFNGDGIQDLAAANGDDDTVTVLLGNGSGGFTEAPDSPFDVGNSPSAVAVGDFNGDGLQDLTVANYGDGSVTILLGNGSGGFTEAPGSPFGLGNGPYSVVAGDFNGDGIQDLATANSLSNNVTVLLGNGAGGFTAAPGSPFAAGAQPEAVVAGDFNLDGLQDLATANRGGNVTVLLGNGAGGFTAAAGSPFAVGTHADSVAVGDFNGDSIPDLATANLGTGNVTVLLGNGSGGFAQAAGSPFAAGAQAGYAVVADFNRDGIPDLAVANFGSNNVTVLLGALSPTTSVLSTTSPLTINPGASVPLTLVVTDTGTAFNPLTGTATFKDGATVLGTATQSTSPYAFTASGLAPGNHSLTASYSGGSGSAASSSNGILITVLSTQTIAFGPLSNKTLGSGPVALTATASSGLAVTYASNSISVCTVSGTTVTLLATGACSITASQAGNGTYAAATPVIQTFTITSGTQTITFDAIPNQILGGSPFPVAAQASSLLPVVLTSTTPSVCRNADDLVMLLSAGTCSIRATQAGNGNVSAATPVTRSFAVRNANPAGTLTQAAGSPITAVSIAQSVAVGDFNGDGIPDLAVPAVNGNNVTVLLGNGSGGFTVAPGSPFAVGSAPYSVAVGDFNGDGYQDLVTANVGGSNVTVLLGNGSGGFTQATGSPIAVANGAAFVVVGDFNGDGIQDIATSNGTSNVTVLLGNGSGGFTPAAGSPFAAASGVMVVADFNGDGFEDLATINTTGGKVTVLLGNGAGGFTPAAGSPFAVGTTPVGLVAGDFNGDGVPDLAIVNQGSNNVAVLLGNGTGGFTAAAGSPFAVTPGPASLVAADLNGDGIPDLAIAGENLTVLLGNGSGGFTPAAGSPFFDNNTNAIVAGDFNGDGIPDLASAGIFLTILLGAPTPTTSLLSTTSPLTISPGQAVPLTLTVSDTGSAFNTLTGTATFSDGSTVLGTASQTGSPYSFTATGLTAGSHTLTASYGGGSGSAASTSNAITIQVASVAAQTIAFGPLTSIPYGQGPVLVSATASSGLPVTFSSTTTAVCTVSGNLVSLVNPGICSIMASQAGNGTYTPAPSVVQSFSVTQATQSVGISPVTGATVGSAPVALSASASSGLPVTFSSSTPGVCTVSGSAVSFVSAGTCSLTATQSGNADYSGASASVSFTVGLTAQTITFSALSNMGVGSGPFSIGAVSTSGLTVVFASGTPAVCKVSGDIVTIVAAGTCSITASQNGNASYAAASPVTQSFTVTPPFTITTSTLPTGTVNQPYSSITLAATGGSGTLSWIFVAGSFPAGMSFNGNGSLTGTPTAAGTFSFSVKVVDATGNSALQGLSLQINSSLSITTTALPNGILGVAYKQSLAATGGSGNYTWSVSGGALPPGIGLSAAGALTGAPTASGSYSFSASVSDGVSKATQSLSIQVGATLSVTTQPTLGGGVTGNGYSASLAATGGTGGPYTWSVASGTLPAGLALSPTGTLSGNPSVAGTFGFTVQVADGSSPAATLAVSLTIYAKISITTTSLPNGTVGQAYTTVSLAAKGGSGTVSWSASGLPAGLTLSAAGVLAGTPSATGTSNIMVTAADPVSSQTLSSSLALTVVAATPGLKLSTSNLVVGGGVNSPLSGSLTVSGGTGPYTFSASGLPAGVTLSVSGNTATVTGSSSAPGTYMVTITATDTGASSANIIVPRANAAPATITAQLTIQVLGLMTAPALPSGAATALYTTNFAATGGTPPYVYSATGLPPGLSLSGSGVLSGMVMSAGPVSFTVQTSDSSGLTSQTAYSLNIRQAPVSVPAPQFPVAIAGVFYTQMLAAAGGTPPYTWSVLSGTLPAGLSLAPSGTISGVATTPGISGFAAQATDSAGGIASASVTIKVTPSPLLFTTDSLPSGIANFAYPQVILGVTGGTSPYKFSITDGALAPGLTLANGVIAGTPTTAGTFPLTITATDASGIQANADRTITIRPAIADLVVLAGSVSFSLTTGATGVPSSQTVSVESSVVAQMIGYTISVNPSSPWLSVASGGTTPANLVFSLTSAALSIPAGTTEATVTLTCTSPSCQGNTQNVSVSLSVSSPPPQLSVTNGVLSFTSSTVPPQAQTQPLGIQNIGGGALAINSITCEAPWCTVGAFPASLAPGPATSVNITVNPATLSTGYYRTAVDIASSSGSQSVPVTFFIASAPVMNLAPGGTQFTMQAGGAPGNPNGSFLVTVVGGTIGWTATLLPGANWVTLNTGSGTSSDAQAGTVTYSINGNAASLTPQAYYATIEVTSAAVSNSPQDYQIVLNVTPANQAAVPDPEPAGLLFRTAVGGAPAAQPVTVYSSSTMPVSYQASAATTSGGSWLSVAPTVGMASSSSPGGSMVSVSTTGLAPGVYTGGVSYAFGSIGVRTVNVTLLVQPTGGGAAGLRPSGLTTPLTALPAASGAMPEAACSPTMLVPTETALVGSFSAPATWPVPLAITLADDCGNTVSNATVSATFTNGDPELALPLASGGTGLYSGTWTPGGAAAQITITASLTAPGLPMATVQLAGSVSPNPGPPSVTPNGIVNAFSSQQGGALAPGTVIAIYGNNLASIATQPTTVPLPTTFAGSQVRIGGMPAPLFYVSPGQINAQIPFSLNPAKGPYFVAVSANGAPTAPHAISLVQAQPALATYPDGTLIAQHGDYSLVTVASPAQPGEFIVMYLVGMGAPTAAVADGSASPAGSLTNPPILTIGNEQVTPAYAGLTPTAVGLYQINVQIPPDLPGGNYLVSVSQNSMTSNTTILPVAF